MIFDQESALKMWSTMKNAVSLAFTKKCLLLQFHTNSLNELFNSIVKHIKKYLVERLECYVFKIEHVEQHHKKHHFCHSLGSLHSSPPTSKLIPPKKHAGKLKAIFPLLCCCCTTKFVTWHYIALLAADALLRTAHHIAAGRVHMPASHFHS